MLGAIARAVIIAFALIPFLAFEELDLLLGHGRLRALLFAKKVAEALGGAGLKAARPGKNYDSMPSRHVEPPPAVPHPERRPDISASKLRKSCQRPLSDTRGSACRCAACSANSMPGRVVTATESPPRARRRIPGRRRWWDRRPDSRKRRPAARAGSPAGLWSRLVAPRDFFGPLREPDMGEAMRAEPQQRMVRQRPDLAPIEKLARAQFVLPAPRPSRSAAGTPPAAPLPAARAIASRSRS